MKYEIITDSAANLPDNIINEFDINVISLTFIINGKEFLSYIKGKKTDNSKYYELMRRGEMIKTSQINESLCYKTLEDILKKGKDLIYISFSSALSGTYEISLKVINELSVKYPDRKIYTIDSLSASMGQGLMVYYAAKFRAAGKSIDYVKDWLIDNRLNFCHWFTVSDLHFLRKGGRISSTSAILGTIIGIKPVLHVDNNGKLIPVHKVRGRKKSLITLVNEMEKTIINPTEQIIFISHGDCLDDARLLEKLIKEKFKVKDIVINYVDPVIGSHSGPDTLALFFMGSKR